MCVCVLQKWQVLTGGNEDINRSGGQLAEWPTCRVPRAQWIALSSCLFPTTSHISFSVMYQETWEVQRSRGISQDLWTCGYLWPVPQSQELRAKTGSDLNVS